MLYKVCSKGEVEPLIAVIATALLVAVVVPMLITFLGGVHQIHISLLDEMRECVEIEAAVHRGDVSAWAFYNRTYGRIELFIENRLGKAIRIDEVVIRLRTYGLGTITTVYKPRPPIMVDANNRVHISIELYNLIKYPITIVSIQSMLLVLSSGDTIPVNVLDEDIVRYVKTYEFFDPASFAVTNISQFFEENGIVLATTSSFYPLNKTLTFDDTASILDGSTVLNGFVLRAWSYTPSNTSLSSDSYEGYVAILNTSSSHRLVVLTLYTSLEGSGSLMQWFNSLNCSAAKVFIHNFTGSIIINNTAITNYIGKISNTSLYIDGSFEAIEIYCLSDKGWFKPEIVVGYYKGSPTMIISTLDVGPDNLSQTLGFDLSNVWLEPLVMVSRNIEINGSEYGMLLFVLDLEIEPEFDAIPLNEPQPLIVVGIADDEGTIVEHAMLTLHDLYAEYNVVSNRGIVEVYIPIPRVNKIFRPFIGFFEKYQILDLMIIIRSIRIEAYRR